MTEHTNTPAPRPVFYAYLDTVETPIRADRWFAQVGGDWMAVTPDESEDEWFADCDPAEWPTPRVRPIEDVPTTGTLNYLRADFTPVECPAPACTHDVEVGELAPGLVESGAPRPCPKCGVEVVQW